ncbi:hypothetical protein EG327_002628 [Venturia inaequalis]|uniref:Uncharacterized protein n=2 Tax=Venturia inaequalis TaxID=5025 RepID=A0A8H3VK74_VENIN|nr:hypothetical protein EG327_002628 [Venturia inaequalis]
MNMLPPVAPAVLERNPRFKALYQNLATSRLNSDASTRLIKQQRAQADVEKDLTVARKDAAVASLLQGALSSICQRGSELPPELLETCHIITAQLNGELTPSDLDLLADDIDYFTTNIPTIALAISKQLEHLAITLAKLTTPDGTLQNGTPDISRLPDQATALQESIANQTTSVAMTRMRITELGEQIHGVYRELFEVSVRIIEQTLHGSVARGGKARAEHLASVAKGMELKLQILSHTDPTLTNPHLTTSLKTYLAKLSSLETDLASRHSTAELALKGYETAGKGMSEIASKYVEAIKEGEEIRREIERLEERGRDVD